ncbi:MEDS domain-containing protein [Mucilaginibacter sp.]|uniref:MEDS domain-containing protein n=1 Tax=Mucilaginibacter sp. TaxID=1882438 RepID=UPI00260C9374|nr:MEDS domain-containing protein [Mucilaginibacter sp.]
MKPMKMPEDTQWMTADPQVFWGEIAPTDHVVQIYENDDAFLNLLLGFVSSGLNADECVVVIATTVHLTALTERLNREGYDVAVLSADKQLIRLDAEETLAKFMVNGWPDAQLFQQTVSRIIKRDNNKNRRVRAFGEMVALLWVQGQSAATIHLENLWNRFCETEAFCLFCAYPKTGFTQDIQASLDTICCAHSKMISGEHRSRTKVFYKTAHQQAS